MTMATLSNVDRAVKLAAYIKLRRDTAEALSALVVQAQLLGLATGEQDHIARAYKHLDTHTQGLFAELERLRSSG